jgi:TonB family protein
LIADFVDTITVKPGSQPPILTVIVPVVNAGNRASPAQAIEKYYPAYPEAALQVMLESSVVLDFTIDASGGVSNVRVLMGHPVLEDATRQAVQKWRFRPAMLNSKPRESHANVTFNFRVK